MSTSSAVRSPPYSLFLLPIELRQEIYSFALYVPFPISKYTRISAPSWDLQPSLVPSLLLVSNQIYTDASPIFYSNNTFDFGTIYNQSRWSDKTPYLAYIRHFQAPIDYEPHYWYGKIFGYVGEAGINSLPCLVHKDSKISWCSILVTMSVFGLGKQIWRN